MLKAHADIVIFGGGIAGLWTRFALEHAGFSTVLLSTTPLGEGQTVLSQGILHSGLKYSLSDQAAEASRQLLAAQPIWLDALEGKARSGEVPLPDLRAVRTLATHMHMWGEGLAARLTLEAAKRAMRSDVRTLDREDYPPAFLNAPSDVALLKVEERAVDASSLVAALAAAARGPMILCRQSEIATSETHETVYGLDDAGVAFEITDCKLALCAGAGNAGLLQAIGVEPAPLCQARPLHMLAARNAPADLFAHCIQPASDKPYLTITTSTDATGARVWYIGGDIAEKGVQRSESEQIEAGKLELEKRLPWLDTSALEWSAIHIDRAEGRTPEGHRPDGPVVRSFGNSVVAWPTKLALAPIMAGMVLSEFASLRATPGTELDSLRGLTHPSPASPPWVGAAS